MTTACLDRNPTSVPVVPRRPPLVERLRARLVGWPARVAHEMRLRRAARCLEEMPDQLLSDIGLARGDIHHAVRRGRPWRDDRPSPPKNRS